MNMKMINMSIVLQEVKSNTFIGMEIFAASVLLVETNYREEKAAES